MKTDLIITSPKKYPPYGTTLVHVRFEICLSFSGFAVSSDAICDARTYNLHNMLRVAMATASPAALVAVQVYVPSLPAVAMAMDRLDCIAPLIVVLLCNHDN